MKGHLKNDCYKLKKKDQSSVASSSILSAKKSTHDVKEASSSVGCVFNQDVQEASPSLGCVINGTSEKLEISNAIVEIIRINNLGCSLNALVDTGSPVSFIFCPTLKKFFGQHYNFGKPPTGSLKALNKSNIFFLYNVIGSLATSMTLALLPNSNFKVNLHITNDDNLSFHVILGRDFFYENKIKLMYEPSLVEETNRVKLFNEVASIETVDDT